MKRTLRCLTKSRFKLGLECPNKLYYTRKKEYANQKNEDPFLKALAEGGFQVEELARMHYPDGVLIEGNDGDYHDLQKRTQELLQRDKVTIFEAAFLIDGLFIRTDILVKKGNDIELIEVKSKSYDPFDENLFIGKKGGMVKPWKPYLFDVAFQKHVIQLCYPDWSITAFLMMANKRKTASIDGLNQLFRITKTAQNRTGIDKRVDSLDEIGDSVLGTISIDGILDGIYNNKFKYHDSLTFLESINELNKAYQNDVYFNWPTSFSTCKACEFKSSPEDDEKGLKSGFKECFTKQHQWGKNEFAKPNTFDIWDFRKGGALLDEGILFKEDLTTENIGYIEQAGQLSRTERQWIQIEKDLDNDASSFIDTDGLQQEIGSWNFPLHFIDFETSTVALPFNKGRHPYEQIAFQFSHHIYHEDGTIEHASEYINDQAGVFPNFDFLRALKKVLSKDQGTIFRYATHENTILNAIYTQLSTSQEADKDALMAFIQEISHSKKDSANVWRGERDMVDLLVVIKKYYYNPHTKGSNSIKAVLPAVLHSSSFLQDKYANPIGNINISSKNFKDDHVWLRTENNKVVNPYKMLPKVFDNWTEEEIEMSLSEIEDIDNGGAALTAYGKLQYTDMSAEERKELSSALLKYCELDTLAMVMIYEYFKKLIE
ncbi:DUF2779 domain-containing protein [Lutimonas vermicola]|uniref:DUF2779 domain-containing protein n=1 Tax=Lutimonas vermicola TaxID=414288 RepID=A0ABU9KXB8_9FLAO